MGDNPELLYVGVGRTVQALDRFSGRPVWQVKLPKVFRGSVQMILPHQDELYVARPGYVYCLDRFSGEVLWERGMNASGSMTLLATAGDGAPQQQQAAGHAAAAQRAAAAAGIGAASAATAG